MLADIEAELCKLAAQVKAGRLKDPAKIALCAGKVVNEWKMAERLMLDIADRNLAWQRD